MLLPIKDMAGKQLGELEVSDAVFAAPVNNSMMHQALVRQLANARLGNHSTKTRGQVRGGGRKPWRQKGTGRARAGSTRSPNWVGGGTVFGPTPRSYTQSMPRKMRRAALRSAISVKAAGEQIVVMDDFKMESPKTKNMMAAVEALGDAGQSVLFVLAEKNENVQRSAGNLSTVKVLMSSYLNIRDVLGYDLLVFSKDAVEQVEVWLNVATEENGAEPVAPESDVTELDVTESDVAAATEAEE
jgi:large subunit ribosomal protein L4